MQLSVIDDHVNGLAVGLLGSLDQHGEHRDILLLHFRHSLSDRAPAQALVHTKACGEARTRDSHDLLRERRSLFPLEDHAVFFHEVLHVVERFLLHGNGCRPIRNEDGSKSTNRLIRSCNRVPSP